MNARTIIITAGAVAALAAPGLANAKMLPVKHHVKHVVKPLVVKQQATPRPPLYIYYPAPLVTVAATDQATSSDAGTSTDDTSAMDDSDDC
jgi:hypothetical protein